MSETSQHEQHGAGGRSQPTLDALYRLLVENSVDVVAYSVAGVLQWISPSVTDLLGWTPAELIGTTTAHLWHPDDRAAAVAVRDAVYAGRTGRGVFRLRAKDGHYVWIETSLRPFASDGQTGAVGSMRDVGDRVRAERALAESEERFRLAMENAAIGMCLTSPQGRFLTVNPALCAMLGRDAETLKATTWQEITHPDDLPADLGLAEDVLQGRISSYRRHKRFLRPDGAVVWGDLSVACVRNEDGSVHTFIAQIADVSAQVAAEEALRRSEAQARAIIDNGPDLVFLVDREYGFVAANERFRQAYQAQTGEEVTLGQPLSTTYHPEETHAAFRACCARALAGESFAREFAFPGPDGTRYWEASFNAVRQSDGAPSGVVVSIRDVTERHLAADTLAASEKKLRLATEAAEIGIWTWDLIDDRLAWDNRLCEWYEVPDDARANALYSEFWRSRVHPDDRKGIEARLAAARATGTPYDVVFRIVRTDGEIRYIHSAAVVERDAEGKPAAMIGINRDITPAKRLEEALRESQEHYRLLAENASDAVFRASPDGVYEWFSASVTSLLGWAPEELVGRSYIELVHPDDIPRAQAALASLHQGTAVGSETRMRTRAGAYRWIAVTARPLGDATGTIVAVIGSWRDIQAQVEARRALAASQAQLRATLDNLLDPHVVLQPVRNAGGAIVDFIYAHANRAACAYMGMDRERLVGARLLDLLPGQAGSGMLGLYAEALASGTPLVLDDYAYLHEILGAERRYDIRGVPVGGDLSITWRDVTGRHGAVRLLAESEERFQVALDAVADVLVLYRPVLDEGGRFVDAEITWVNRSAQERWFGGRSLAELQGLHLFAEYPQFRDLVFATYRGVVESGVAFHDIIPVQHPTNGPLFIDVRVAPYSGGFVHTGRDVTSEQRAQAALAEGAEHLRAVVDSLLDPMVVLTAVRDEAGAIVDFVFSDANQAAADFNRLPREQLIGVPLLGRHPSAGATELLDLYRGVVETGTPLVLDDWAYPQDMLGGEPRCYDVRAVRFGDGLAQTWRDVTERYETVRAVHRRVAELAALQRISGMLVERVDLAGALDAVAALLTTLFAAGTVQLLPAEPADDLSGGAPAARAAAGDRQLSLPLVSHDEPFGTLLIRREAAAEPFGEDERALATTIADLLAAVLRSERRHEYETEEAAEEERRRIARDLHDAVTQSIYSANLLAEALPTVYAQSPEKALEELLVIRRLIRAAFAELRILLYELRPETLAMAPLATLFERLRDALTGRAEIAVALRVDEDLVLPPEARTVFYRIAQEALNNVGKYARAQHVTVALTGDGQAVTLTVRDDGLGFAPAATPPGMGTGIMRERAGSIGARLTVESAPGAGTTVTLIWRPAAGAPQA